MQKINIGILFGGKSAEHEISLKSAKNIFDAIDKDKYNPVMIKISKEGDWEINGEQIAILPNSKGGLLNIEQNKIIAKLDAVFPILHGPFGEDGTVQGLLKLAGVPFVGPGVLGAAAGMDKDIMKRLLRDAGLKIGKFRTLKAVDEIPKYNEVIEELGEEFFIKPANMGSSIGINQIYSEAEYFLGVQEAFKYDTKIIIEEFINGREIECAVLGNESPKASVLGEIAAAQGFYSYDAKYIDKKGATLQIPAIIDEKTTAEIREIAIKTFRVLECEGLGRVDIFLAKNGEIFVNEINTIPGFTEISMYPKLWEATGVSYTGLIDKLIQLGIERFKKEQRLKTSK